MGATVRGGCSATPAREMRERAERDRVRDQGRKRTRILRTETPFDHMTVAELRTWAQKYDVENYGRMRKEELAELVKTAYEGG